MASPRPVRTRTLWPLPGGTGSYLAALAAVLKIVRASEDARYAIEAMIQHFAAMNSAKTARSYLKVAAALGLVELDGSWVSLTEEGERYLAAADPQQIRNLLLERIDGVRELLAMIASRPARVGVLLEQMRDLGYHWQTPSQVRYRLRWLEEVGAVRRHGGARPFYRLP